MHDIPPVLWLALFVALLVVYRPAIVIALGMGVLYVMMFSWLLLLGVGRMLMGR